MVTDGGTLAARALAALSTSEVGCTPAELAAALFGPAASRLAPLVAQAAALLARLEARGDAVSTDDGRWVARWPDGGVGRRVRETNASIVPPSDEGASDATDVGAPDTGTGEAVAAIAVVLAGVRSGRTRLIEAAVVRLEGGVEVLSWSSLANPDPEATGRVRLPSTVLERAGLEPDAFEGAPAAPAVIAELGELIAGTTVVGHDVAATLDALGLIARWHGVAPPYRVGMRLVDTEAVARAALPDLVRPSLDRVAAALGVPPVRRDRAPERARQVAAIWRRLSDGARPASSGVTVGTSAPSGRAATSAAQTLGQRVAAGTISRTAPGAFLPEAPGMYRFHDASGSILYVGKATNLRGRVAQHFGDVGISARGDALLSRVTSISHVQTVCELDAVVVEQAEIASAKPPYNVQATARPGPPYLSLDLTEAYPRIGTATAARTTVGAAIYGPYRTAADARTVARAVVRAFGVRPCTRKLPTRHARLRVPCLLYGQGVCPAPCAPHVSTSVYAVAVDLARTFLEGGRDAALAAIDGRLRGGGSDGTVDHAWLSEVRRRVVRIRVDARPLADVPRGASLYLACEAVAREGRNAAAMVTFHVRDGHLMDRREWREADGAWVATDAISVAADAPRDAIIARRVQRDLGTPRVHVSRWGAASDAALGAWVADLGNDPYAWADGVAASDDE